MISGEGAVTFGRTGGFIAEPWAWAADASFAEAHEPDVEPQLQIEVLRCSCLPFLAGGRNLDGSQGIRADASDCGYPSSRVRASAKLKRTAAAADGATTRALPSFHSLLHASGEIEFLQGMALLSRVQGEVLLEFVRQVPDVIDQCRSGVMANIKAESRMDQPTIARYIEYLTTIEERFLKIRDTLMSRTSRDASYRDAVSGVFSSASQTLGLLATLKCWRHILEKGETVERVTANARSLNDMPHLQRMDGNKFFRVSRARRELAQILFGTLIAGLMSKQWVDNILLLRVARQLPPHAENRYRLIWPPDSSRDVALQTFEKILGWKVEVRNIDAAEITLAIDFGDSLFVARGP